MATLSLFFLFKKKKSDECYWVRSKGELKTARTRHDVGITVLNRRSQVKSCLNRKHKGVNVVA